MQINGTSNSNTDYSRITGLATGMDIDGMVKKMVAGDNMKLDQMKQNRQIVEWQQEAYIDIIKDLKEFYNSYLDILSPTETNIMSSLSYSGLKTESSDTSKIKATAFGGALKGNYKVVVSKLAEGAKIQNSTQLSSTDPAKELDLNSKLSDIGVASGDMKITVNGKDFTVKVDSNKSISDFLNDVRNTKLDGGSDVLGIYININFSELTKKFTIETKGTGEFENLKIENVTGDVATKLGIVGNDDGQNAEVTITPPGENIGVTVEKLKNSFTIDNIQYDINAAEIGKEVIISVQPDATDKVEKFKKFINKYNSLIDKIKTKIDEKKEYKFKPLTEAQKDELSDDEIKRWNEKAKKGIFSRENNLSSLIMNLRQTFYSTVEGAGLTPQEIGIETTDKWRDGGKLKLDEEKFKQALETKGDQVEKLFIQSSTNKDEKGILQRFKDTFDNYVGSEGILIKKAGYKDTRWVGSNDLSKKIEEKNKAIKEMENKIFAKQERYYQMFAILERNMNNLNSQSNWLYSQLGTA